MPPLRPRPGLLESPQLGTSSSAQAPGCFRRVSVGMRPRVPGSANARLVAGVRLVGDWEASPRHRPAPPARLGPADPPRERQVEPPGRTAGRAGRAAASGRAGLAGDRARSKKSRGQTGLSLEGVHLPWVQGRGRTRLCPLSPCAK